MRKIVAVIIALIVVIAIAAPYGMGILAKKKVVAMLERSGHNPNVSVIMTQYERGWFESNADLDVQLILPPLANLTQGNSFTLAFKVKEHIIHGPIVFSRKGIKLGLAFVESHVELDPMAKALVEGIFKGQKSRPQIDADTLFHLTGSTTSYLTVPPYLYQNNHLLIHWKGLNGKWCFSGNYDGVSADTHFAGLVGSIPQAKLLVGAFDSKSRMQRSDHGLWTGTNKISLNKFALDIAGTHKIQLDNMSFNVSSNLNNQLFSTTFGAEMKQLQWNGRSFGPGRYKIEVSNLDAKALAQIHQVIDASANLSPELKQQRLASLAGVWLRLIARGAKLDIQDVRLTMPEGNFLANGSLGLDVAKPNDDDKGLIGMIQRVNANVNVEMPVIVAERIITELFFRHYQRQQSLQGILINQLRKNDPNGAAAEPQQLGQAVPLTPLQMRQLAKQDGQKQLTLWLERGLIKQEGNQYKLQATLNKGELKVNGKVMNELSPIKAIPQVPTPATPMTGVIPVKPKAEDKPAVSAQ